MDEHSWKGHNFTLLIFGGVVVLCSIFFILGMLVGRSQIPEVLDVAVVSEETLPEEEPEDFDLRFYESVEESEPPPFEVSESEPGSSPEPVVANQPSPTAPLPPHPAAAAPEGGVAITLQIAALSSADQAETLRAEIAGKGFSSFVVRPAPEDQSGFHRVQVGPFSDQTEVARVRALLEAEGYQPIVRN
jgi:hypothetical protein